jgi:hypothetical protein
MNHSVATTVAVIAILSSPHGFANSLPDNTLPPIQSGISVCVKDADGNNVCNQKSNAFGHLKISDDGPQGPESASASISRGPNVALKSVVSGYATAFYGPRDVGTSGITYAFELVGPDGAADVDYSGSGTVSVSPGSGLDDAGFASLYIEGPGVSYRICSGAQGFCGVPWNGADSFEALGTLTVQANTVYTVILSVQATDVSEVDASGTVSAKVFNELNVNPAFAGSYKIKFSKGVIPRK